MASNKAAWMTSLYVDVARV